MLLTESSRKAQEIVTDADIMVGLITNVSNPTSTKQVEFS